MNGKVYGISGTNKGRKEVIDKEDIVVIKEIIPPVSGTMAAKKIQLPDEVSLKNGKWIILSITFDNGYGISFPEQLAELKMYISLSDNTIDIKTRADSTSPYTANIALMKVSD
mgnify:CR=1 FL=1